MTALHSKHTIVTVDGNDISEWCKSSEMPRKADTHDITGYGKNSHVFYGGLLDATGKVEGFYDTSASGPRAVLEPLLGTTVEFVRQLEGAGTGKPQDVCDVIVTGYNETSPVADMVTWTLDFQVTDDVDTTVQS